MSYRFVDHTAELQLELESPTRAAVFEEAVLALAEVLGRGAAPKGALRLRELVVAAKDDPALLAAWLDELVFVAETEGLVPRRVESIDVDRDRVRSLVSFVVAEPIHVVKGVTYHDLRLWRDDVTWRGRVVLDV
jgi:SHS2 domain-containing protein